MATTTQGTDYQIGGQNLNVNNGNVTGYTPTPISTSALSTPQTPLNIPPIADTTGLHTSAILDSASSTNTDVTNAQTGVDAATKEYQKIGDAYTTLLEKSQGKAADTQQAYNQTGATDLLNQVNDYKTQIDNLARESTAIPLQTGAAYQGSSGTQAGVASVNRDLLQRNALQALTVAQASAVSQGKYDRAKQLADQYVTNKYAGDEAKLKAMEMQMAITDKLKLTPAQEKLKEATKAKTEKLKQDLAEKRAAEKAVSDMLIEASPVAPPDVMARAKAVQAKGGSAMEVAMALGQYGGDFLANEKLKLEMAKIKAETGKLQAERNKLSSEQSIAQNTAQTPVVAGWVANINSGKAKLSDVPANLKSAVSIGLSSATSTGNPAKLQGYTDTLNLIKGINDSGALSSVVGPSAFGRVGYTYNRATGESQDFTAKVQQLTEGLTLQALIDSKSKGATFGALSEGELNLLAKSATRLNSYKKTDSNGNVYYDVNESGFKSALKEIQNYTQTAFEREGGSNFVTTGNSVADQFVKSSMAAFNSANTSTPAMQAGYVDNQK